jgi:hypothetical protein
MLTVVAVAAVMIGYAFAMQEPTSGRREARSGRPGMRPAGRRDAAAGPLAQVAPRRPRSGMPVMRPGEYRTMPMRAEDADRMGKFIGLVRAMKHICFDPEAAGVLAVGGLKDDVRRKTPAIAKDLEAQLAKTKTLGLRNAIRLSLKDIYKKQEDDEKVLVHLRAMLAENDAALQARKK